MVLRNCAITLRLTGSAALRDNHAMPCPTPHPDGELDLGLQWNNSFARLGEAFFTPLPAQPLPSPYWIGRSHSVARELGLEASWLESGEMLQAACGNRPILGTQPLASVYSGHQFGQWAGQLGDGRALLLGETASGWELQLKGSGFTPYSRMGDGRAVLRSSIREFLCSEAMQGLGIPTTRALCVTGSDAPVQRETTETAAVVVRVAPSFIRFGHFEHFSYRGQHAQLKILADYVIERFYPNCRTTDQFSGNPYAELLAQVTQRTAQMLAQWQAVGFCHGVMNTDNMSILGVTIDYGPFQFLDEFSPGHVCNHSDTQGRYAFDQQPNVAHWNLFCLAQALMPLVGEQELALAALEPFKDGFVRAWQSQMFAKLGLCDASEATRAQDAALCDNILALLATNKVDHTIFWRRLSHLSTGASADSVRDLFSDRASADHWLLRYSERTMHIESWLSADLMLKSNPKFVLRNHLAEQTIQMAKLKDFSGVNTLLGLLASPFEEHPGFEQHADFPPAWAGDLEISCSS